MEAAISGIRVAGKTGTAQKANIRSAGYADEKWLSSFAGFVPADNPKLVISIMIDEPRGEYYGGIVAGPPFREVAEQSLAYLGLIPQPEKRSARERRARLASLPKN